MKNSKMIVALFVVLALSTTSCVSDDDDPDDIVTIVGKWNYNRVKIFINGQIASDEPYDGDEPGCERDYFDIRQDGTAAYGEYYLNPGCSLTTHEIAFVRSGNNVILGEGEEAETAEVLFADPSTMVLRFNDNNDGSESTIDVSYTKSQ